MTINNIKTHSPLVDEVTLTLTGKELLTVIAGIGETNERVRADAAREYFFDKDIEVEMGLDFYRSLVDVAEQMGFHYKD